MSTTLITHTTSLILNTFGLEPRTILFPNWIMLVLLFSALLVSSVRFITTDYLLYMWQGLYKNTLLQIEFRTGSTPIKRGAIILTTNYFISSTLLMYMLITYLNINTPILNALLLAPISLYIYTQIVLFITGLLTGELKKLKELFIINTITYQWFGLIILPLLLLWLLNPNHSTTLLFCICILFGLLTIIRIFKTSIKAIENKLPWYYIILYFCTVEMWPVLFILNVR